MSNIDKRPFRADGGDISTGRLKEIADNPYGDEEKCWLAKRVLALLDELEAMHKYAKDRDAENEGLMITVGRLRVEKEAAERRIAELEAREVTLPRPVCTYADHSYPAYSERQVVELLESLGIRINREGE